MTLPRELAALILAAGHSSRMGTLKPLLPIGDETVIEKVIGTFRAAGVEDIVVILGHAADRFIPLLDAKPVRRVINHDFEEGMYSSIQAGVRALPPGCRGFFILPGDMPFVRPETIAALARHLTDAVTFCRPCHEGRRGHPPLLSAALIPDILAPGGPAERGGLRALLAGHEEGAIDVACDDPGILIDLDTPSDYARHRP